MKEGYVNEDYKCRVRKRRQEEEHKDCRPLLLCEDALPAAVFVSLSFLLSLHLCFNMKAGSLKGRIFKCVGLQAHPATKHIMAQTQKDGED